MEVLDEPPASLRPRPLAVHRSGPWFRWTISDPEGRTLADGAGWHSSVAAARREVRAALELLLESQPAGADEVVAAYLAALPRRRRDAVVRMATELAASKRRRRTGPW